jgi:transposase
MGSGGTCTSGEPNPRRAAGGIAEPTQPSRRRSKNFATSVKGMAHVLALDEGRFGLKTWLRRRWCPRGVRPPWIVEEQYEWVWVYMAVEPMTGRSVFAFLPSVEDVSLLAFLGEVRRAFGWETIGMILDNASSHRSQHIAWPTGIQPIRLPAYSPELNPAEQVFRYLRQRLANRIFDTIEELEEALVQYLRK